MMTKSAEQIRHVAPAMDRGDLIDRFLDWVERLSVMLAPAPASRLARIEIRIDARHDR
jgi:hypothetical protein